MLKKFAVFTSKANTFRACTDTMTIILLLQEFATIAPFRDRCIKAFSKFDLLALLLTFYTTSFYIIRISFDFIDDIQKNDLNSSHSVL